MYEYLTLLFEYHITNKIFCTFVRSFDSGETCRELSMLSGCEPVLLQSQCDMVRHASSFSTLNKHCHCHSCVLVADQTVAALVDHHGRSC